MSFSDLYEHGYSFGAGVRFHYVSTGQGSPVVLLHGFPESWFSWHNQLNGLSGDARLYAFDLKGYGDSDKPLSGPSARYDLEALSRELGNAIHALNVGKVMLIGHDWGGILAYLIAVRYPTLISKVILMNMSIRPFNPLRFWYGFTVQLPLLPDLYMARFGDQVIRSCYRPPISLNPSAYNEAQIEFHQAQFRKPGVHTCGLAYYRNIFQSLPFIQSARRRGLKMPVEIVWGEGDPILTVGLAKQIAQELAAPLHLIESAGHFVQSSRPAETNSMLAQAIRSL